MIYLRGVSWISSRLLRPRKVSDFMTDFCVISEHDIFYDPNKGLWLMVRDAMFSDSLFFFIQVYLIRWIEESPSTYSPHEPDIKTQISPIRRHAQAAVAADRVFFVSSGENVFA